MFCGSISYELSHKYFNVVARYTDDVVVWKKTPAFLLIQKLEIIYMCSTIRHVFKELFNIVIDGNVLKQSQKVLEFHMHITFLLRTRKYTLSPIATLQIGQTFFSCVFPGEGICSFMYHKKKLIFK